MNETLYPFAAHNSITCSMIIIKIMMMSIINNELNPIPHCNP